MCHSARAVTITFDDQPLTIGNVEDTRTISTAAGNVTFSGGAFVPGFGSVDLTTVYQTIGPTDASAPSFSNPLTITFENPVTNFSVLALGLRPTFLSPGTSFVVSDNADNHSFGGIPQGSIFDAPWGFVTIGLNTTRDVFTIFGSGTTLRAPPWFFAIDNVSFDPAPPVPLPATLPLFATGLSILGLCAWRRKRKARYSGQFSRVTAL